MVWDDEMSGEPNLYSGLARLDGGGGCEPERTRATNVEPHIRRAHRIGPQVGIDVWDIQPIDLGSGDARVRDQIIAETQGNRPALLKLPHGPSPAQLPGYLAGAGDLPEVSRAARALPAPAHPPQPVDLLIDGLALVAADGLTGDQL